MRRSNVGIGKRKGGRKEKLFKMIGTLTTLRNCLSDLSVSDTRIKILYLFAGTYFFLYNR